MKNKTNNKILSVILCTVMLICLGGTVFAASEKLPPETVYVTLDTQGISKEIIVKTGGVEQKIVSGDLPFDVKILYLFNDAQVIPQDILGMSGNIKITIDITPNSETKDYYKKNLALQMQFPIDTKNGFASNIIYDGLTGVTVGTIKTLSGIVLPAKSAKYEISYDTQSFEQQSINFVCMPFDFASMANIDVSSVKNQITDLQNGISQYVDGVKKSSKGLLQTKKGIESISSNGATLLDGYSKISESENALIQAMFATMSPEQQEAFSPQIQAVQGGKKQITDNLSAYIGGISQATVGLAQINAGMAELAKKGTSLNNGITSAISPLLKIDTQKTETSSPESFISVNKVSEIQFVMKTDSLTISNVKEDTVPLETPKSTFWNRLLALFGL